MNIEISKQNLLSQFTELNKLYPELSCQWDEEKLCLKIAGNLHFKAVYNNCPEIEDTYTIRINVPWDFSPSTPPLVYELCQRIPLSYHHYLGGNLCLGVASAIRLKLLENCSLVNFVDNLLVPYLYAYSYYELHNKMPWGSAEHSDDEKYLFYKRFFKDIKDEYILDFLLVLYKPDIYRMHRPCLCGSKKKMRYCHGNMLLKFTNIKYPSVMLRRDIFDVHTSLDNRDIKPSGMLHLSIFNKILLKCYKDLKKDYELLLATEKK